MNTFFDYDGIECVTEEDAREYAPYLKDDVFKRFCWEMGSISKVSVMTLADLYFCLKAIHKGKNWRDYNYTEVKHCSVCRTVILPDEEAYVDDRTMDVCCDKHSYQDADGTAHKKIF